MHVYLGLGVRVRVDACPRVLPRPIKKLDNICTIPCRLSCLRATRPGRARSVRAASAFRRGQVPGATSPEYVRNVWDSPLISILQISANHCACREAQGCATRRGIRDLLHTASIGTTLSPSLARVACPA